MAYLVTFHGVTPKAIDDLRELVEGYGLKVGDESEGIVSSPDTEIAFRYSGDSNTLDVSIRRKPRLLSYGELYGRIADALIDSGVEHLDALVLRQSGPEGVTIGRR
jgi:hypothetical protein